VDLDEYGRFITSASGQIDSSLFEANVRDYEGETAVNDAIRETLATPEGAVDFWWLNNGVTIIASRVQPTNKLLDLENPQIVNGLQTSTEIFKREAGSASDQRSVLVKIIEASDPVIRDRIIRATNSQTQLALSALRATDRVQRQIEEYLLGHDLYYERRKRQYFNLGRPVDRIVSIEQLGQAMLSTITQAPHVARSSPSAVFEDETYDVIFNPGIPLATYAACVKILHQSIDFVKQEGHLREIFEDFAFHLAMATAMAMTRKDRPGSGDLAKLENVEVPTDLLREMLDLVQEEYNRIGAARHIFLTDQLAKSREVTVDVRSRVSRYLRTSPKA
jgi:hypothetical protein